MTEREKLYEAINRLGADPTTAKDATILWLMLKLAEATQKLAEVRAAAR